MRTIFVLIVTLLVQNTIAQENELLIIGTMHEVPSVVSHSYRPLLKYAKKYKPEAIFVEDIRPNDTLSLKNFTPRFLRLADSISYVNTFDEQRFQELRTKQLAEMDADDFAFLSDAYMQKRDRANYTYYNYLKTYGIAGAKRPLRNENGDLIFPLAISMGITELLPIDDHQVEPEYQRAWRNAMKASSGTDDGKILATMIIREVVASLKQFRTIATKYGVSDEWTGRVEATIIGHLKAWGEWKEDE